MISIARRLQLLSIAAVVLLVPAAARSQDHWVGTWAAAPLSVRNPGDRAGTIATDNAAAAATGVTLREIVHITLAGSTVRIVLSNEFGQQPLKIGSAAIALRVRGSNVNSATAVPLTFSSQAAVVIPSGALVVSDAATIKVPALSDVAVSLFLPDQPLHLLTQHTFANQTSYVVSGNAVTAANLTDPKEMYSWDFLKGMDVLADASSGSIVTFGDSITDGVHSSRDKNARWPDLLAARLQADKRTDHLGVLNEGIGGNRILNNGTGANALARFDRDVLGQDGVKYLVILEAINDIGRATNPTAPADPVSADDLVAGYLQLNRRAHAHGIKVIIATLTPYVGASYQSPAGEEMRQALNQWIRTTKEIDGFVDFDEATQNPAKPGTLLPAADGGDHLHPSDAGYKLMSGRFDLKMFTQ